MVSDCQPRRDPGVRCSRLVELSRCAATVFGYLFAQVRIPASWREHTTIAVHEKHKSFIHRQPQPRDQFRSTTEDHRLRPSTQQVGSQTIGVGSDPHHRTRVCKLAASAGRIRVRNTLCALRVSVVKIIQAFQPQRHKAHGE